MTHEHLIEDVRNVMAMTRAPRTAAEAQRIRNAVHGLQRHLEHEGGVPERVLACLAEAVRVVDGGATGMGEGRWGYAHTCLEAALEFATGGGPEQPLPVPPA